MDTTISLLARTLGATAIETAHGDARFIVDGLSGARLKVSVFGRTQRFMGVLTDAQGQVRSTVDIAPVSSASEDPAFPGRVTLHVGRTLVHIDTKPTLAIEVVSEQR
jgi:hypothetical protein